MTLAGDRPSPCAPNGGVLGDAPRPRFCARLCPRAGRDAEPSECYAAALVAPLTPLCSTCRRRPPTYSGRVCAVERKTCGSAVPVPDLRPPPARGRVHSCDGARGDASARFRACLQPAYQDDGWGAATVLDGPQLRSTQGLWVLTRTEAARGKQGPIDRSSQSVSEARPAKVDLILADTSGKMDTRPGWAPDPLMVGIRSPDGLVVGLHQPPWSFGFDSQTRGTRENRRTLC